jgi:hypothetical protein
MLTNQKQRIVLLLLVTILAIAKADQPWNLHRATHAKSLISKSNIHAHAIQQYPSKQLLHAALSIHGGDIDTSDDDDDDDDDGDSETSEYDSSSDGDDTSDDEYDNDNDNANANDSDTQSESDTSDEYDDETESEETEDESQEAAASSASLSTSLKKKSKRNATQKYDDPLSLSAMQDMGVTLTVMLLCNKLDLTNAKIIKYARYVFLELKCHCMAWTFNFVQSY